MSSISREREIIDAVYAGESTLDLLGLDPSRVAGWEDGSEPRSHLGGAGWSRPLGVRRDTAARGTEGHSASRSRMSSRPVVGEGHRGD